VALSDFVPGLQGELQKHGVQSRVYDAGTQALACPVTLSYVGYVKWDTKVFTDAYTPYLTYAALTLRRDGRVLGTAQYRLGSFGQDKWASAGDKLAPLVDALFPGNPGGGQFAGQHAQCGQRILNTGVVCTLALSLAQ
jgi:hypothetical protein